VVLRKGMTLGLDWEVAKPNVGSLELCLRAKGKRKINIRLPGGEVARFEARDEPECAFGQVPPVSIQFLPLPGTTTMAVTRDLRTGQFPLTCEDLNIEPSASDIVVTRTDDARVKHAAPHSATVGR
jgi:hypothetical protein